MSNNNILEPVVNAFVDVIALVCKVIFKTGDKFDIEEFFRICKLKNSIEEHPVLYKTIQLEDGVKYLMTIPQSLSLKDFQKYQDALAQQTNTNITMSFENGFIEIVSTTAKDELKKLYPYENIRAGHISKGINIPLGYSLNQLETIKLFSNPHSYIVGSTGGGKSICIKSILTYLVVNFSEDELSLYLGDLKYVELSLFKHCKIVKEFRTSVEDVTDMIRDLLDETEERYRTFESVGVTCIQDYNRKFSNKKMKYQILVVEEIVNLLQDGKKRAMKMLKRLISISRSAGLFVIVTTQRPSADVLDVIVKANISNRIVFHTESSKDSVIALDEEGAENLDIPGRGILKIGSKKVVFQGFYIEDEEVKRLIKPYLKTEIKAHHSHYNKAYDKKVNDKKIERKTEDNKESARNVKDLSFLDKL
ncbi:MAG: FtsK/SpoIIIE domain-containing protein [Romboutsia timonensis]|uniref:FtsK/SpoIIIE domain-containing protein n=1 Tax=Romboutsia timonensis TaxID=1776391 RepID=UPI002A747AEB|nr:FtsK/SpoIIIE domain-containing protein [Romboutsia timonensis]MDY2882987.1 FtsK/SpoIIIE domain-containing protein [Romboutsia timonensis]